MRSEAKISNNTRRAMAPCGTSVLSIVGGAFSRSNDNYQFLGTGKPDLRFTEKMVRPWIGARNTASWPLTPFDWLRMRAPTGTAQPGFVWLGHGSVSCLEGVTRKPPSIRKFRKSVPAKTHLKVRTRASCPNGRKLCERRPFSNCGRPQRWRAGGYRHSNS